MPEWAEQNKDQVDRLREALDDLWACIAKNEIGHLQPETVQLAKQNHELLWHEETP